MKNDNMKKDWTDLLREKLESYTPDVPKASFEEIREKMLAAGAAAGAGAGAAAGAGAGAALAAGAAEEALPPFSSTVTS